MIRLLMLLLLPPLGFAQTQWWDNNYQYRRLIGCNTSHDAYTAHQHFFAILDFATNTDSMENDLDDVRIVFQTSGSETDLGRYFVFPNSANTDVWFECQENLVANADLDQQTNKYYMYYGYSGAGSPPTYTNADCIDAPYTADNDCIVLMHFEETSGNYLDESSNGNNSEAVNVTSRTYIGKFGYCPDYDGSNDYVRIPDHSSLDVTYDVTMECWAYVDVAGNWTRFIFRGGGGCEQYNMASQTDPALAFDFGCSGDWHSTYSNDDIFTVGSWYHLAITYDGDSIKFFQNGSQFQQGQAETESMSSYAGDQELWFGGETAAFLNAKLDEIRVSNIARTTWYHVGTEATLEFGAAEAAPAEEAGQIIIIN